MKNNKIASIDVCKGICILFVIITHFSWTDIERKRLLFPFWIDMAIPIFLVISGYVMSLSYQRKQITTVEVAYRPSNWLKSFIRYTLPFIVVCIVEFSIKLTITIMQGGWCKPY